MFPSMNNSYPLFYSQSQSLTATPENNHISFQHHQHQQEFYSSNFSIPTNTISPNIISTNPINTVLSEAPIHLENPVTNQFQNMGNNHNNKCSIRRVSGRKDRHTKICTAQGVRDRRVRLSISIAREFFNLQDMLGFDKASKTLGWLLEKSKAAIDELTRCGNKRSTVNEAECSVPNLQWNKVLVGENIVDNCVDDVNNENEDVCEEKKDGDCGKGGSKKRGLKDNCNNDRSFAKEIMKSKRVKARERARERTKHKKTMMNYKNQEVGCISLNHQQCDQQKNEHNSIFRQSNCGANALPSTSFCFGVNNGVSVGESVVVKSKSKGSSQDYTNFEMISSKDHNEQMDYSNYYYNDHFTKFELENNHVGIIQQPPGLSAFNIINLSTEIHINARPWDTCNNQILD